MLLESRGALSARTFQITSKHVTFIQNFHSEKIQKNLPLCKGEAERSLTDLVKLQQRTMGFLIPLYPTTPEADEESNYVLDTHEPDLER